MIKTILICGAGGQVGHELSIAKCPYQLIALTREKLDITDRQHVAAAFDQHQPDIVINSAAYTQVDRAEQESELAYAINRDGVADLAYNCKAADIPLLHISTDYVFDGGKKGAYLETDPIAPLGTYGDSKAEGEAILHAVLKKYIVLRTSWVFSATGDNFVKTMLRLGRGHEQLGIVDDQRGCPTSARSIANVLLEIAARYLDGQNIEWGIYHYCNRPETTWHRFAREIFKQATGFENLKLNPIATTEYPTPARRPQNSVLDCSKIESILEIKPKYWSTELGIVLDQLKRFKDAEV